MARSSPRRDARAASRDSFAIYGRASIALFRAHPPHAACDAPKKIGGDGQGTLRDASKRPVARAVNTTLVRAGVFLTLSLIAQLAACGDDDAGIGLVDAGVDFGTGPDLGTGDDPAVVEDAAAEDDAAMSLDGSSPTDARGEGDPAVRVDGSAAGDAAGEDASARGDASVDRNACGSVTCGAGAFRMLATACNCGGTGTCAPSSAFCPSFSRRCLAAMASVSTTSASQTPRERRRGRNARAVTLRASLATTRASARERRRTWHAPQATP